VDELLHLAVALDVSHLLPPWIGKPYGQALKETVTELLAELRRRGELLAEQRSREGPAGG